MITLKDKLDSMTKTISHLEFIITNINFRFPYNDISNVDYQSLFNENFSIIDLMVKELQSVYNVKVFDSSFNMRITSLLIRSISKFQNKWHNSYKQWVTDYKRINKIDSRMSYTYHHINLQVLFPLVSKLSSDIDNLSRLTVNITNICTDIIYNIRLLQNLYSMNFIMRFLRRNEIRNIDKTLNELFFKIIDLEETYYGKFR